MLRGLAVAAPPPPPAQEADRFNRLLGVLRRSCNELQRAVKGLAVMSSELEAMSVALLNNQVGAGVSEGCQQLPRSKI
jgi:hypothetical protein